VILKEIRFGNDHQMYEEAPPCEAVNPSFCWGAGPALSGPDWRSVDNPDHPVCFTRNSGMSILVSFEAQGHGGGTAMLRVTGPDGVIGEAPFTAPCGSQNFSITVPTSPLPDVVKAYTPAALNWFVRPPETVLFFSVATTTHRLYVTLDTPTGGTGNEPTNRRMNFDVAGDATLDCYNANGIPDSCEAAAPKGACCLPSGCLAQQTVCRCTALSGTWQAGSCATACGGGQ
jgi:hypothetical protein